MLAVLHFGRYDGAEFDIREWASVPENVWVRQGGRGPQGLLLSRVWRTCSARYIRAESKDGGDVCNFYFAAELPSWLMEEPAVSHES